MNSMLFIQTINVSNTHKGSFHVSTTTSPRKNLPLNKRFAKTKSTVKALVLTPSQEKALTAVSLPTLPIIAYSEFALGTTGCGLPPGPSGLYGAAEGISYLILAGLVSLSVYVKIKTGKGLPAGPAGLLGAAEGIAYLLVLIGILDAAYVVYAYGDLPTAVPTAGSRCFPV